MAYKCENCGKGKEHGHMVSHAKNRLARIFKPNLQKLKVLKNGVELRVKFCTSCIKRMRKDGRVGVFSIIKLATSASASSLVVKSVVKTIEKETQAKKEKELKVREIKAKETLDIASIVGKKN